MKVLNPQYISIGSNVQIGPRCRIEAWNHYNEMNFDPSIILGEDVRIHSSCHIGSINSVVIGDNCLLGSNVLIIDHAHGANKPEEMNIHPSERNLYSKGSVVIGRNCWICENAVILPGVTVGNYCVIGANSVVTKDVPSYSVAVGNPAIVKKNITAKQ